MVKLTNGSITIEVPENEVKFYLRAGYRPVSEAVEEAPQKDKKSLQLDPKGDK
jgi:hypothetical protein